MDIKEIIKNLKGKIYSENMVKELCDKDIGDYERGIVAGRIEAIAIIENDLNGNDDDDAED